ncbi:hypothetical protein J7K27_02860 [Candidatus Bathyarchaeota archaeon]|nr:hypothetical protein [Candidatus Bathyarchaeota archaeon]
MVKIRRRLAKKKYLDGKYTYAYERFYIEIPKKYQDRVKWLLDKDLKMDIKKVNGKLLIVLSPRQIVSACRKDPFLERIF